MVRGWLNIYFNILSSIWEHLRDEPKVKISNLLVVSNSTTGSSQLTDLFESSDNDKKVAAVNKNTGHFLCVQVSPNA